MNNEYNKNKLIFKILPSKDYELYKDIYEKDILIIQDNDKKIKCKYIMIFTEQQIDNKKSILMWSDSNLYIDNMTRHICTIIRKELLKNNDYLKDIDNQIIKSDDLKKLVKTLIKDKHIFVYKNKNIDCKWIITNDNANVKEYYMITDIIYY